MPLPSFTANAKLTESADTKVPAVARAYNALVANLQQLFTYSAGRVQDDSVILKGVSIVAGTNTIPHTLGRTLTGWIVVRVNALVLLYEGTSQDPATYLVLVSDAACTVSLEVF